MIMFESYSESEHAHTPVQKASSLTLKQGNKHIACTMRKTNEKNQSVETLVKCFLTVFETMPRIIAVLKTHSPTNT